MCQAGETVGAIKKLKRRGLVALMKSWFKQNRLPGPDLGPPNSSVGTRAQYSLIELMVILLVAYLLAS